MATKKILENGKTINQFVLYNGSNKTIEDESDSQDYRQLGFGNDIF